MRQKGCQFYQSFVFLSVYDFDVVFFNWQWSLTFQRNTNFEELIELLIEECQFHQSFIQ